MNAQIFENICTLKRQLLPNDRMILKTPLYFLILFFLPFHAFAEETLEQKVRNILNDKSISESYTRLVAAYDTVNKHVPLLSYEEVLPLCSDILLPFADKEVKNSNERNTVKAHIYEMISLRAREAGDYTAEETFLKKGVEHAEISENDALCASAYYTYANLHIRKGSIQVASDYLYKAIKLYESIERYDRVADCLYRIAETFLQIRDVAGLRIVIEQMKQNIEKQRSVGALYSLYAIQVAYYNVLSEKYPENEAVFNDSALWASRNTISLIENHRKELPHDVVIAWDYYNMSICYENCYPENYDSIFHFLDKALESLNRNRDSDKTVAIEIEISVYISYAELHFDQKKYDLAEKDMLHVLSLLEQIQDFNSVIAEYAEAYKFFIKYYETTNRPWEVIKYHELLLENEKRQYNNEKITAMNDMLVKYETEKKEEEIDRLAERNRTAQKILMLTVSLIAVLFIALLLFIRFYRLRKKNLEQSIYETALLAELRQNELEQNRKEKEQLQQQYNALEAQASQHEQKTQPYLEELKRIKQQLEQKPTKTMIEKLTEWISDSLMEKSKRTSYVQKLSELDVDMLEQGYLTANEKISNMDMRYIICFSIDMDVKDISLLFNVEPTSVRTVRYRIKKKFGGKNTFKFLI
ncbi:MAG: hypothetical protein FWG84_03895 [Bacteroidales bacterium]|nr:hypothetical protein [Bacteroidales bacterium]